MGNLNRSMSLAGEPPKALNTGQKLAVITGMTGMGILILQLFNLNLGNSALWLSIAILAIFAGIIWFSQAAYAHKHKGIKNDGVWFKSMSSRGVLAWMAGIALTGFYIVLYFYPQYLGLVKDGNNTGLIALFDPLSKALSGNPASQWFVYGTLYTVAILAFGAKFIWKYRHNKYEQLRTVSVMFFQTAFAFFIPEIMARLNGDLPYYDLKNMWPLNYYNFERYRINGFIDSGSVGMHICYISFLNL